ncbi:hypothetical protein [Burkholderia multivorans]|uniref:hypothetical protein n=1 Tax=Burkholderia multivorans TaxID=87883 RepID=UPI0019D6DD28|nr:hypothetical protein [Burkholderia multivorans]MBN8169661.1 hypothetical protein [Burkholderia multivorans]
MDDTQHHCDFPPLDADQIRDLAAGVQEEFGDDLPRPAFTERLLMLFEYVPGFEMGDVPVALIETAWVEYSRHHFEY